MKISKITQPSKVLSKLKNNGTINNFSKETKDTSKYVLKVGGPSFLILATAFTASILTSAFNNERFNKDLLKAYYLSEEDFSKAENKINKENFFVWNRAKAWEKLHDYYFEKRAQENSK